MIVREKMSLTSQDIGLLKYLIQQNSMVTVKQLAEFFSADERSIRYRLDKIQQFLGKMSLSSRIEMLPRKGLYLTDKVALEPWLKDFERRLDLVNYQYTVEESLKYITLKLIIEQSFVENSELRRVLNLSGPTVRQYLEHVKTDLADSESGLELAYVKRRGSTISGSRENLEKKFVNTLLNSVNLLEIINFIKNEGETQTKLGELLLANVLNIDAVELAAQKAEKLEIEINRSLSDLEYIQWIVHYVFEKQTAAALVACRSLSPRSRMTVSPEVSPEHMRRISQNSHINVEKFADELIDHVESVLTVNLRRAGSNFESSLKAHLKSLDQRIQTHHPVENPIYESFVAEYGEFTQFLENIIGRICAEEGVVINQQEISLIAILFLSEIQKNQQKEEMLPAVLVICTEGRIISNIVANRIRSLFDSRRLDICPVHKVSEELMNQYDIVFSTIPMPEYYEKSVIHISSFFTREDLKTISGYMPWKLNIGNSGLDKFGEIVKMIEKNATVKDWAKLEFMLLGVLNSSVPKAPVRGSLEMNFGIESVRIIEHAVNWEKGIDIACEQLIADGCIEPRYREKIKSNTREFGAYMTVSPGVFIAHAGLDDGCLKDGISVTKFCKGLKIVANQSQPIDFVITVAFSEAKANVMLERTVSFIRDKEKLDKLRLMTDKNDIYHFFRYHYSNL